MAAGHGDGVLDNPVTGFIANTEDGQYISLTDSELRNLQDSYEAMSDLVWDGKDSLRIKDVVCNLLVSSCLSSADIYALSQTLAEITARVPDPADPEITDTYTSKETKSHDDLTPKDIYASLAKTIVGQDKARKNAATLVYLHLHGIPSTACFCGPTGSGKTEIWRSMSDLFPGLVYIFDASSLTAEGYKGGTKASTILKSVLTQAQRTDVILVLDEADKIFEPHETTNGNYSDLIQNNLLKLLEHDVLQFPDTDNNGFAFDCSRLSVVLLGAFSSVRERIEKPQRLIGFGDKMAPARSAITIDDIIFAGAKPEIAGRIQRVINMDRPTVDDYKRIAKIEMKRLSKEMHKHICANDTYIDSVCAAAFTSGLGARYLKSKIREDVDDTIFDWPATPRIDLSIKNWPFAKTCG